MSRFIIGVVCLTLVYFMLRVARPRPNGEPAAFLSRESLAGAYALAVTMVIGLGLAMTVSGGGSLVATVAAGFSH